jgi:hypothetical protein
MLILAPVGQNSDFALVLWTTDIPALSGFLATVAGMTIRERHPGFALLGLNGTRVELHADETYRGHPWYDALHREGAARGIGAEIRVRVDGVEDSYDAALRLGGLPVEAPCEVDGTFECQVMGPDGFLLTLWEPAAG